MKEHMHHMERASDVEDRQLWLSSSELMARWNVSRSQVTRIAIKHSFKRLDTSTGTKGNNQGVRYSIHSIKEYEAKFSY